MKYKNEVDLHIPNTPYFKILPQIEEKSKVLEIGCACGHVGNYLAVEKQCNIIGVDACEKAYAEQKSLNTYSQLLNINLNDIGPDFDKYKESFDYILFMDVLEHVYNPEIVINKIKNTLKNDGYIFISLPNLSHGSIKLNILQNDFIYTKNGLLDENHIRFFTLKSLIELMNKVSLEIISLDKIYHDIDKVEQPINLTNYPKEIINFIEKDPESYVYQYIVKARICEKINLEQKNMDFLKSSNHDFKEINKYTRNHLQKPFWYTIFNKK